MKTTEIGGILRRWAGTKPLVNRVRTFGSRARGRERADSDQDVAVELDMSATVVVDGSGGFATWTFETAGWPDELSVLLPFEVDVEQYREEDTPMIHQGLTRPGELVYTKSRPSSSSMPTPLLVSA